MEDMNYMFYGCSALTSLDLSDFNTSNVVDINNIFDGCTNLTSIIVDIQGWNMEKVTSSDDMFSGCTSLTGYDASNNNDVTNAKIHTATNNGYLTLKTPVAAFTYYDSKDMSEKLAQLNGATITSLTLGRTFPTETYGTVCLPVSLSEAQVTSVFGTGTIVKSLTGATYDSNNNRLTLTFTQKTDGMDAGVPYLIKSAQATPATLSDVTISPSVAVSDPAVVNGLCQMHGVLNPSEPGASPNYLFVSGGQLYYSEGGTLKGMRAYFELYGDAATAANNSAGARPRVSFDGDPSETGILSIDADGNLTYEETGDWYTLGGVKLSGKPVTKGMYILNGKKYIVK